MLSRRLKKKMVTGKITRGKYKGKNFEIKFGKTVQDCKVIINGKELQNNCLGVHIHITPEKQVANLEFYEGE